MPKRSESKSIPNRPDKTIDWLGKSRDEWKNKTLVTKATLKVVKQGKKRAQASRSHWKERYQQVQTNQEDKDKEIERRGAEIEGLKKQVLQLKQEAEDLKKKSLYQTTIFT